MRFPPAFLVQTTFCVTQTPCSPPTGSRTLSPAGQPLPEPAIRQGSPMGGGDVFDRVVRPQPCGEARVAVAEFLKPARTQSLQFADDPPVRNRHHGFPDYLR